MQFAMCYLGEGLLLLEEGQTILMIKKWTNSFVTYLKQNLCFNVAHGIWIFAFALTNVPKRNKRYILSSSICFGPRYFLKTAMFMTLQRLESNL